MEEERIAAMMADMTKQLSECNKQLAELKRLLTFLRGHQRTVLTNIVTNLVTGGSLESRSYFIMSYLYVCSLCS